MEQPLVKPFLGGSYSERLVSDRRATKKKNS
jgi:hypothetical protein